MILPKPPNAAVFCMFGRTSKYLRRKYSQAKLARMSNKLGQEKSPYLLQHAHNPVHWLPWNDETIELAKSAQKPIFLSSGYSTCHWCHVMERESFENERIAGIMNEHFINIKLDREEHPDIDKIYMTFIQAMSGSGGWPMSVWLTPDLKPFYGGTYFPPEDRYFGRPGFRALLESLAEQWAENKDKCIDSSNKIIEVLEKNSTPPASTQLPVAPEVAKRCNDQLARSYEPMYGGFSEQPKFPQPVNLQFLIQYAKHEPRCFQMVDKTLKYMRKGGIYDHLGKGFCRYSTDKKWHVPHFEKMLYDQAQLTVVYLHSYLQSKEEFFSGVAQEILEYVSRDMSIPEGGFYSAEDADSLPTRESTKKAEGAFYAWEHQEIETLLGDVKLSSGDRTAAELFIVRFGVKQDGNVDPYQDPHDELKKKNVIFEAKDYAALAKEFGIGEHEVEQVLQDSCAKLFDWRNANRPRPHLDNKFITSWNGLMISAYAQAGYILANQAYVDRAVKAGEFVQQHMIRDGDLLRTCYSDGVGSGHGLTNLQAPIYGCVDDFSNIIAGAIDLFQATGHAKWIKMALDLQTKQNELFWDSSPTGGGYFSSRATDKNAIVRMKDDDDGAEPSSNSISLINLLRLQHLFPDKYSSHIEKLLLQFGDRLTKLPITLPLMAAALLSLRTGVKSYTAVGKNVGKSPLVKALRAKLLPTGGLVILLDTADKANIDAVKNVVPLVAEKLQAFEKLGLGSDEVVVFSRKQSASGPDGVGVAKTVEELEKLFE